MARVETRGAAVILCVHPQQGAHSRLLVLLTSSFYAFQKAQLRGAATRGHHEITTLCVAIVTNMDEDINIEIFGGEWDQQQPNQPLIGVFGGRAGSTFHSELVCFHRSCVQLLYRLPKKQKMSEGNKGVQLLMQSFALTHRLKRTSKNPFNPDSASGVSKAFLSKCGG